MGRTIRHRQTTVHVRTLGMSATTNRTGFSIGLPVYSLELAWSQLKREGSVVRTSCCSSRTPSLVLQQTLGSSQRLEPLPPGNPTAPLQEHAHLACTDRNTDTHTQRREVDKNFWSKKKNTLNDPWSDQTSIWNATDVGKGSPMCLSFSLQPSKPSLHRSTRHTVPILASLVESTAGCFQCSSSACLSDLPHWTAWETEALCKHSHENRFPGKDSMPFKSIIYKFYLLSF